MRIRYWARRFDLEDIEDVAARLAPALAERGHELALVAPQSGRPTDAIVSERLSIHRVDSNHRGAPAEVLPPPACDAPDVDLFETGGALSSLALATVERDARPVVASIHGPLADTTHQRSDPEGQLLQRTAAIAVDTEAIAGQVRAFVPGCGDRTVVIEAGLPLTELAPGPRLLKRPTLLAVGPLHRDSGFDIAIEALADIRSRFGTAELTIIGDGPERAALESQTADLGLTDVVDFRGFVAASRLPAIINQSSLIVVPSRVPVSGSAIAILGGQLLRPVIASAIGGLDEIIEQHGSGLLVVPEDPAALAGAARRLLSEPGGAADLGRRGRTLARERFGWHRFVDDMERVLTSALSPGVAQAGGNLVG